MDKYSWSTSTSLTLPEASPIDDTHDLESEGELAPLEGTWTNKPHPRCTLRKHEILYVSYTTNETVHFKSKHRKKKGKLNKKKILNPKLSNTKLKWYFTYLMQQHKRLRERERGMKWEFSFITELELLSSPVEESPWTFFLISSAAVKKQKNSTK